MTVVVTRPFKLHGRKLQKGDVLFDHEARAVLAHPVRKRNVSRPVRDEVFAHRRPEGWTPEAVAPEAEKVVEALPKAPDGIVASKTIKLEEPPAKT